MKAFYGKVILADKIIDAYVTINSGKIIAVDTNKPKCVIEKINGYIAPGLIDIHYHSSYKHQGWEYPEEVADFNLSHGITSMLITMYRDIPHESLLLGLERIKRAMQTKSNLYGAHLEGPYLDVKYGYALEGEKTLLPDKARYYEYVKSGIVRQWTSSPEVEGVDELIKEITNNGIVAAIGHSAANYEQVKRAYDMGAKIVTHIFDATGTTGKEQFNGVHSVSFDEACMLMDDMFYEVICDSEWVHVKKEMLDLLIKMVGIDRVVAISDSDAIGQVIDDRDISVVNGQLSGTKLTLDKVVVNLFNAGYEITDIFKMVSLNPAKALKLNDRGEIAVGKRADLIALDYNLRFSKILKESI